MTVEQTKVIDIISTKKESGDVWLTISDHLSWANSREHQTILQAKLNSYLAFVESGEIFERYPSAMRRPIVFHVVFKFRPDLEGQRFLLRAEQIIKDAGFELRHELFAESCNNRLGPS